MLSVRDWKFDFGARQRFVQLIADQKPYGSGRDPPARHGLRIAGLRLRLARSSSADDERWGSKRRSVQNGLLDPTVRSSPIASPDSWAKTGALTSASTQAKTARARRHVVG